MMKIKNSIVRMISIGLVAAFVLVALGFGMSQKAFADEQTGSGSIDVTVKMKEGEDPNPPVVKYKVTVPQSTLDDGTIIPGVVIEVNGGDILNNDQVDTVVNREGQTPDKWDVTYTDPATGQLVTQEGMTTEELRELLDTLEIEGDVTVVPTSNSQEQPIVDPDDNKDKDKDKAKDDSGTKAGNNVSNDNSSNQTSSNENKSEKQTTGSIIGTGDVLGIMVAALGSAAIAALIVGLILARKRRKEQ